MDIRIFKFSKQGQGSMLEVKFEYLDLESWNSVYMYI